MPMEPWIFLSQPLESIMGDFQRTFDAWEAGGIRGIVVGRLIFQDENGQQMVPFTSNPDVFEQYGVDPPDERPPNKELEKQFRAMLQDASKRDWHIMVFAPESSGASTTTLSLDKDPYGGIAKAARMRDAMEAFPEVHGGIMDGPAEHSYELQFHHGGEAFAFPDYIKGQAEALGYDVPRIQKAYDHLKNRFQNLSQSLVRFHACGGALGSIALFDINEDVIYWQGFRQDITQGHIRSVSENLNRFGRRLELGAIFRSPAFTMQNASDYLENVKHLDYVFPKHYFWHRGFDGMYGTVARWVKQIADWNPALTEEDCFAVVKAWFGLELPGVNSLWDMELAFPDEFFDEIVTSETRRALAITDDPEKIIAWVSTGRDPHWGDQMPVRDLYRILVASEKAGLKRFLFHSSAILGASEWTVLSKMFGQQWDEDQDGYWPPESHKPKETSG